LDGKFWKSDMYVVGMYYGHLLCISCSHLVCFMYIWHELWTFSMFYGYLVHFVVICIFFCLLFVVPRNIWQPCYGLQSANLGTSSLKGWQIFKVKIKGSYHTFKALIQKEYLQSMYITKGLKWLL
jgi:hypothetical protein